MSVENPQIQHVKPVLTGYIRQARFLLDPLRTPDDKAVHDVRVFMKRSRATLKLLRTYLGDDVFKHEYSTLREVGRIMGSWRETSVLRKLLRDLKKKSPDVFTRLEGNDKLASLLEPYIPISEPDEDMKKDIGEIIRLLHKSEYRIRFIPVDKAIGDSLTDCLSSSWAQAAEAYVEARYLTEDEKVHELRKKTKDLLFQICHFKSLNPRLFKNPEKKLDTLGRYLGKYNDLSVLLGTIDYKLRRGTGFGPVDELMILIRSEQDKYLGKIWPLADRLYHPGNNITNLLTPDS